MDAELLRGLVDELPRAEELAERLCASGPKAAHVSRSETHEIKDFILAAASVLRAFSVAQGQGWRPIESAPRDGSTFIAGNFDGPMPASGEYEVARYEPYYWNGYEPVGDGLFKAKQTLVSEFNCNNIARMTHWMPLPAAPAQPDGVE